MSLAMYASEFNNNENNNPIQKKGKSIEIRLLNGEKDLNQTLKSKLWLKRFMMTKKMIMI